MTHKQTIIVFLTRSYSQTTQQERRRLKPLIVHTSGVHNTGMIPHYTMSIRSLLITEVSSSDLRHEQQVKYTITGFIVLSKARSNFIVNRYRAAVRREVFF